MGAGDPKRSSSSSLNLNSLDSSYVQILTILIAKLYGIYFMRVRTVGWIMDRFKKKEIKCDHFSSWPPKVAGGVFVIYQSGEKKLSLDEPVKHRHTKI